MMVMALRADGNQRYSWIKNRRSLFVNWTRPRTLRCSTISCCLSAAFSASSRHLGLKIEAPRFKRKNITATIVVDVKRFCRQIKTDEVFGTHSYQTLPLGLGNIVLMDRRYCICCGLKMPRCLLRSILLLTISHSNIRPVTHTRRAHIRVGLMPRLFTQYSVFIASPSGLDKERQRFRDVVLRFNEVYGNPRSVRFEPVGWEDTLPDVGRPQDLINKDLRNCDYAVFVLHDRWGTPTGASYTSGIDEEWALATKLYNENTIRNICLFFKDVDVSKIRDPGPQLKALLDFKQTIESERKHFFAKYAAVGDFAEILERRLAKWLEDHRDSQNKAMMNVLSAHLSGEHRQPSVRYWLAEGNRLLGRAEDQDIRAALFCAEKGLSAARTDLDWGQAEHIRGVANYLLNKFPEAIESFDRIFDRFATARDFSRRMLGAYALANKGAILRSLGRREEAISQYNDVVARFGNARELPLRIMVAKALLAIGHELGALGKIEQEIAAYDDIISRLGAEKELGEWVAKALVNKAFRLAGLGRNAEGIAACDEVVARFGAMTEPVLCEQVAMALSNKGQALQTLGHLQDMIFLCDDMVARFGNASDPMLRKYGAQALLNKGITFGALGRGDEQVAIYDEVVRRFGTASELPVRVLVATALFLKGESFGALGRRDEEIAICDEVVRRFGAASEGELREWVAQELCNYE